MVKSGINQRSEGEIVPRCLCVITRGHQQICQHQQLIFSEFLFMFLPVVVMGATEVRHDFFDSGLRAKKARNDR